MEFYWEFDVAPDLQCQLAHVLVERNGGMSILPSLRTLVLNLGFTIEPCANIIYLLSSSLVYLKLDVASVLDGYYAEPAHLLALIRSIFQVSPLLESVVLETLSMEWPRDGLQHSLVAHELLQLERLCIVQICTPIRYGDVHTLLSKFNIVKLQVVLLEDRLITPVTTPYYITAHSLRALHLAGAAPVISRMLEAVSLPALEHMELLFYIAGAAGADTCLPVLTAAAAASLSSTLHHVQIRAISKVAPLEGPRVPVSLMDLVRPYLRTSNMQEFLFMFGLSGRFRISAGDADVAKLGQAFPLLRTLVVSWSGPRDGRMALTPYLLLDIARSCPQLRELRLPYLDHTIDLTRLPPTAELRPHALRGLYIVGGPRARDEVKPEVVDRLCDFLCALFPHAFLALHIAGKTWNEVSKRLHKRRTRVPPPEL